MNNFDLLIEKYSNELIQAKKRSILSEIEDANTIETDTDIVLAEENTADDYSEVPSETSVETKEVKAAESDEILKTETKESYEPSFGTLKIQIFASEKVYPVQSAFVTVSDTDTGKNIFEGYSDASGIVDEIVFETPSADISQSPSNQKAYSQVDITIEHPRFITTKYTEVPIFANVESIQTVQLIPTYSGDKEEIIISQSEPQDLEGAGE